MRSLSLSFLLLVVVGGCGRPSAPARWQRQADTANAAADRCLAAGDVDGARRPLAGLLAAAPPPGVAPDDARLVRQDASFRLALLELDAGRPEAALDAAARGLALGDGEDVFTANLHIVRAHAYDRLGRPRDAGADFSRALTINEMLLEQALQGTP